MTIFSPAVDQAGIFFTVKEKRLYSRKTERERKREREREREGEGGREGLETMRTAKGDKLD